MVAVMVAYKTWVYLLFTSFLIFFPTTYSFNSVVILNLFIMGISSYTMFPGKQMTPLPVSVVASVQDNIWIGYGGNIAVLTLPNVSIKVIASSFCSPMLSRYAVNLAFAFNS